MKNLYQNMLNLLSNEAFYNCHDTVLINGIPQTFEVFTYRLASETDFLAPDALNARGVTFNNGVLVSLAPFKFHNLYETSSNQNWKPEDILFTMDKLDGSLISTVKTHFQVDNRGHYFLLKSKTSFKSAQAVAAKAIVDNDVELEHILNELTAGGYTVNMEYTSPLNRVVLPYERAALTILNVRNLETGDTIFAPDLEEMFGIPEKYIVPFYFGFPYDKSFEDFITNVVGIEGYVCVTNTGKMFKIKTKWYCDLHHTKDSVNNPRRLYETCLGQAADDLLSMFHDDPISTKMIQSMMELTAKHYNHVVATVEKNYNDYKHLSRKDFAIFFTNNAEIQKLGIFGLLMNLYTGKTVDYVAFLTKNNETVLEQYSKSFTFPSIEE